MTSDLQQQCKANRKKTNGSHSSFRPHPSLRKAVKRFSCAIFLFCLLVPRLSEAAGEVRALRLGYFPNITHAQPLHARATGEFEKALGIPIHWISFNAGPSAVEALFVDAVDATFLGPSPTINGYIKSKGEKFVIVSGASGGGAGMIVRQDSGIRGVQDFNGKIIATPQLGNTQDLAARAWFAGKGYRLKETGGTVALVPLSNPDQLNMFRKKQIDGAWTVEPWLSRLEVEGGGVMFLDEKTLWPDGRYVTAHLVVNRNFLARNPLLVKKLLAIHVKVTQQINADKKAAAKVINAQLKRETGKQLKDEVITRAISRVQLTWDPIAPSLRHSAETAYRLKFLRTAPNLEGIYSLKLLNEVLREQNLPEVSDGKRR